MKLKKRKLFKVILLLIIIQSISSSISLADSKDEKIVNFGVMEYFFTDVNINDAKIAMHGWISELGKEYSKKTGANVSPVLHYFNNINEMMDMIKRKKIDIVILSSYDYFIMDFNKFIEPLTIDSPDERLIKVMLVNKSNNITTLNDLKSRKISLGPGIDGIFAKYWLNMIFKQNKINDFSTFFSSIESCKKSSMVIMQLFFGKTDACVTTLFNFNTNAELNPQIKKNLKILTSSDKIPFVIFGIRKNFNIVDSKILTDIAVNGIGNKALKSMLEFFKKGAVVPYKVDLVLPVIELIKYNSNKTEKEISIEKNSKTKKK
jgi:phosphonate transport system substrate-binding protein